MVGSEKSAEALYGLFDPHPLGIAGSVRYLTHSYEDDYVKIRQRFWMQREISLTFDPAENVSFVGSGGYYGPEEKAEYRRYFGLVRLGGSSIRAGRFVPAFGLEIADHTKGIKELFGQGGETLNLELGYTHKYFEMMATRILGSQSRLTADERPTIRQRDERDGYSGRLSAFLFKGLQLGVSYASLADAERVRSYTSTYFFAGVKKFYLFGEFQSYPANDYRAYGALAWMPLKGVYLKAELDKSRVEQELFGTIQLFPLVHWEFLASASVRQWMLITHYYL